MGATPKKPLVAEETYQAPLVIRADHWIEEQFAKPEQPYLLREIVMPGGLTVIAGRPKLGKSFLAMSMAMAMSSGQELGMLRPVGRSGTLYFDLEGVELETAKRLEGMRLAAGLSRDDLSHLYIYKVRMLELLEPGFAARIVELVRETGVATIVLDTFAASFTGDENAKRDVQKYLNILKEIRVATGCAAVLVHHVNKATFAYKQTSVMMDPDAGLRGSSALQGAYDTILALQDGWIGGMHKKTMIARGKYCGDWWCEFGVKVGAEHQIGDKTVLEFSLDYGRRQNEYVSFETGPSNEQPAYRYPRRGASE